MCRACGGNLGVADGVLGSGRGGRPANAEQLAGAALVRAVGIACQLVPGSAPPVEVAQL